MKTYTKTFTILTAAAAMVATSLTIRAAEPDVSNEPSAAGGDAAAEMARKLNNPLANIKAVMTDNAIGFNTGSDKGTSYGFQLQPVYAMDFPDQGVTFIPRGVIPILGLEPGTYIPRVGDPTPLGKSVWGLGDIVFQGFFAPHSKSKWKWGAGPQLSLGTATDPALRGSHWGAGFAGVVTGSFTENLAFAGIVGNMWSFNGDFNLLTLQPVTTYTINAVPGMWVGYTGTIAFDWKAPSRDAWTVPLGLSIGRTFDLGRGHGLDINVGPYYNVARPRGAADWIIRFGISWMFP